MKQLKGYIRENGTVGFRNHLLILPSVVCAAHVAHVIAKRTGGVFIDNQYGCGQVGDDFKLIFRTLVGLAQNPNVGAVLIVGLGCENLKASRLAEEISKSQKPVLFFNIHDVGGTPSAIAHGTELARTLKEHLRSCKRRPVPLSSLILGTNCGASDATSGICANPILGKVCDSVIAAGGSAILTETSEMIGAEHILAAKAATPALTKKVLRTVCNFEKQINSYGVDLRGTQPAPGNIEGGLSTIEEKSLGCIYKAGSTPIVDVIRYAEPVTQKGLTIMDSTGDDIDSMIGLIASGAQMIVFTTGLGTPIGTPICPVIKITANKSTAEKMHENIDVFVGSALDGSGTIESDVRVLLDKLCDYCNGKKVAAEKWGHREFGIWKILPTV